MPRAGRRGAGGAAPSAAAPGPGPLGRESGAEADTEPEPKPTRAPEGPLSRRFRGHADLGCAIVFLAGEPVEPGDHGRRVIEAEAAQCVVDALEQVLGVEIPIRDVLQEDGGRLQGVGCRQHIVLDEVAAGSHVVGVLADGPGANLTFVSVVDHESDEAELLADDLALDVFPAEYLRL